MKYLSIKNWEQFQHYKDRDPKWIKLHRDVLDDYDLDRLTEIQQIHLVKIWLLAAKLGNKIPNDAKWVERKIGAQSKVDLSALLDVGFLRSYDAKEQSTKEGFVYFIRAEKTNRIKIGFSARLEFRLQEIRRQQGEEVTLIGAFPGDRADESDLHKQFEHFSLGNEWFTYHDDIVYTCVRMSGGMCSLEEETETDTEKENRAKKRKPQKRFTPPTLDEVKAYCRERRNAVDPERFVDFYAAKGWMVGKNRMKDWQAAVRTWEKSDKPQHSDPADRRLT